MDKTAGSLMLVESIVEWSQGEFCNTFDMHLEIFSPENLFLSSFEWPLLNRFDCILSKRI